MNIDGVHTALITPMLEDGTVNWAGLEQLIEFQINSGVQSILLLGTTAETPTLEDSEQEEILKRCIKQIAKRVPVMVGTGSNDTKRAIKNSLRAQELGADSLLLVSPFYNKPTQQGLLLHFKAVAESVKTPIIIYNIFGRTGVNISTDTMIKVATLPNIIGVKEASGSLDQMMEVIQQIQMKQSHFKVSSGDDALTLPLLSVGGRGVISVVSNLFPKEIVAMCQAALNGNYELARSWHYRLLPVFKLAFIETNPAPIKYLMQQRKLPAGGCRLPLSGLLPESQQKLDQLLSSLDF